MGGGGGGGGVGVEGAGGSGHALAAFEISQNTYKRVQERWQWVVGAVGVVWAVARIGSL